MKKIYISYMRLSPWSNWNCQSSTLEDEQRHKRLIANTFKTCKSNIRGWLDCHPNFQVGEWILEWDDKNTPYPSWDILDNLKPNDKNIKIVLEDCK